jgi:hypothetical protein
VELKSVVFEDVRLIVSEHWYVVQTSPACAGSTAPSKHPAPSATELTEVKSVNFIILFHSLELHER